MIGVMYTGQDLWIMFGLGVIIASCILMIITAILLFDYVKSTGKEINKRIKNIWGIAFLGFIGSLMLAIYFTYIVYSKGIVC